MTKGNEIILQESIRAREELLNQMQINSNRMFSLINVALILLGLFISSIYFICSSEYFNIANDYFWPGIAGITILIIFIIVGLVGLLPRYFSIAVNPNSLYEMIIEKDEKVVKSFIETYLFEIKELLPTFNYKPFLNSSIIIAMIFAIMEYAMMWLGIVSGMNHIQLIISTATIAIILIVIMGIRMYLHRRRNHIIANVLGESNE